MIIFQLLILYRYIGQTQINFMTLSIFQGDRLSHAVGCAFAICLEKKQKRDQDCSVTMNFDNTTTSFTRIGSFRQATITERLADPQVNISLENPKAVD